jgi:DNA-directed RNA polymerase subunit L
MGNSMAKKKTSKAKAPEEEKKEEVVSDEQVENDLLGSSEKSTEEIPEKKEEIEEPKVEKIVKPKIKDEQIDFKPAVPAAEPVTDTVSYKKETPEVPKKDYKYLKGRLLNQTGNIYKVQVEGESHTLLNNLCVKLLSTKGVEYAAYKETSIDPAVLTVITDGKIDVKKTLKAVCADMKKEFVELKKLVSKTVKQ